MSAVSSAADDGAAVSQTRDSARRWFVQDHLGSTIALASSTGSIERKYDYTVDGEDTPSGNGPATWIRYAGGHDLGNGLYHFGQRYYSPSSARWTQRDPLDQPDDLVNQNPYVYAGNNSLNFTDPDGDVPVAALVAGGRALYAFGRWAAPKVARWGGEDGETRGDCPYRPWWQQSASDAAQSQGRAARWSPSAD